MDENPPVYTKPYPTPSNYRSIIEKPIGDMLEEKVIERALFLRRNSQVVMITKKKKDGSHRFCCDFISLNKMINPVAYQM